MTRIFFMIKAFLVFFLFAPFCYAAGVDLAWDPPSTGGPVDGYVIYWENADDPTDKSSVPVNNETSGTVSGLKEGPKYNFYVKAHNSAGEGPPSETVSWTYSDTTPPVQVLGVKAE